MYSHNHRRRRQAEARRRAEAATPSRRDQGSLCSGNEADLIVINRSKIQVLMSSRYKLR